ncbi:O-antigen ligase family protein [Algibacter sp. Ld11]|uniref:O-antigen ligase family protein n=1 Tax=Algibacter sp. Ld11 TaxID=649150 RepID=UPI003869CBEC
MKGIVEKGFRVFGNIETFLVCLMAFTIPFKLNFGNLAIIISLCYAVLLVVRKKVSIHAFKTFYFIAPVVLFLISVVSALTSKDVSEGVFQLEKLLLMVLIPFILTIFITRKLDFIMVVSSFSVGVTVATVILLFINVFKVFIGDTSDSLFFFEFTKLYDQHPVYFATNIFISTLFIIHFFVVKKQSMISKKWLYFILLIHFLGLIFCASKVVIFCFLVLLPFYLIINKNTPKRVVVITLIITVFSALSVLLIPKLNERFSMGLVYKSKNFTPTADLLNTKKFSYEEKTNISDLELRQILFKIGLFHLIDDEKVLTGYGLGDVQNYLDYYYMTYNLAPNWYEGFNLHNQYIQYLVTYGLFGFLFFILYLVYSLIIAIKLKNNVHLFFTLMIIFVFIFEVYLARNKGIVLLFFFNTLFLLKNTNFEDSNNRNKRNT